VLKFRDRPDDGKEQHADRGGRVDALIQHHQIHTTGLQILGQLDQMLQRSTEPVELGHHQLVTPPRNQQRLIEPGRDAGPACPRLCR
jgi:hypothetical protein